MPLEATSSVLIRAYRPDDRDAVRTIACETADRGEPVERFFHDRRVFADLLTRYYTDYEPHSLWVAEADGRVVGYLTGCLDTQRYWRLMCRDIIPRALWQAVCRGILGSPQTWRVVLAGIQTFAADGGRRAVSAATHPGHLHLNLVRAVRGQRVGQQLLEQFLAQARAAGVPGVHAAVREDNAAGRRFFDRMGFQVLGRSGNTVMYGTAW